MEITIFSRSIGVMCFPFIRPRLSVESWLRSSGRLVDFRDCAAELACESSDNWESTLEDSLGMEASDVFRAKFHLDGAE